MGRQKKEKELKEFDKKIGSKILFIRHGLGLSRKEVCKSLNVTQQQLHKYENGKDSLSVYRLFSIAKILKVPLEYFINDIDLKNFPDEKKAKNMGRFWKLILNNLNNG